MKKYRLLLFVAAAGLALGSCSKEGIEDQLGGKGTGEIKFEIGFAPEGDNLQAVASGGQQTVMGAPVTRVATDAAFNSIWETGDEIGIFAVRHASGSPTALAASGNFIHNVKLTYNKTANTWTPATAIYYPAGSDQLDFYAYYPYDDNGGNPATLNPTAIAFNVKADQTTTANYSKSDLLSASAINVARSVNPVSLTFAHKLALVEVAIDPAYIDRNGNFTATLRNCMTGGTFNLGSGTLTPSGTTQAIKMMRVETDPATATTYTYRALVPAQTVAQGSNLCLMSQNGQVYNTPALPAALDLTAGAAKRYTSTLPKTALATVKINKGSFKMGSSDGSGANGMNPAPAEPDRRTNETQHSVTLTKDFYMSKYEITNVQYAAFLNATNVGENREAAVAGFAGNQVLFTFNVYWNVKWETDRWVPVRFDNVPMINVTWYGAKAYADWIGGSLPTEAQWEYACRAGTTTAYSFGAGAMGNYTWYLDNSGDAPHAIGQKLPNPLGLYDMHGNVFEWCSDWYKNDYYSDPSAGTDPTGPATAQSYRVLRGGSWFDYAQDCRSAFRYDYFPDVANFIVGLRVVFVP